jgi:hypothetical protein
MNATPERHSVSVIPRPHALARWLVGSFLALALTFTASAVVVSLGHNLVHNPGADLQVGTSQGGNNVILGWEDGVRYDDTEAGQPDLGANAQLYNAYSSNPPDVPSGFTTNGANYFFGSGIDWKNNFVTSTTKPVTAALTQKVDVQRIITNDGTQTWNASAFFSGWTHNEDAAYWDIVFCDINNQPVTHAGLTGQTKQAFLAGSGPPPAESYVDGSYVRLGGVYADEREHLSSRWVGQSLSGPVPLGTAYVKFVIWFDNPPKGPNNASEGAIDDLHFVINGPTSTPEPSVGLLVGTLALGWWSRRRHRTNGGRPSCPRTSGTPGARSRLKNSGAAGAV